MCIICRSWAVNWSVVVVVVVVVVVFVLVVGALTFRRIRRQKRTFELTAEVNGMAIGDDEVVGRCLLLTLLAVHHFEEERETKCCWIGITVMTVYTLKLCN